MTTVQNEFIKTVRPPSTADLAEFFRRFPKEKTRAIVLIVENSFEIDESIYELVENAEIPTILALKSSVSVTEKLVDICHLCIAADWSQIGEFSADDALKTGLINKTTGLENVEAEALALAEKIAALAPLAIRACLKAVREGFHVPMAEGLKIETGLFVQIFSTADMREGTRAFLEKRVPVFTGE